MHVPYFEANFLNSPHYIFTAHQNGGTYVKVCENMWKEGTDDMHTIYQRVGRLRRDGMDTQYRKYLRRDLLNVLLLELAQSQSGLKWPVRKKQKKSHNQPDSDLSSSNLDNKLPRVSSWEQLMILDPNIAQCSLKSLSCWVKNETFVMKPRVCVH